MRVRYALESAASSGEYPVPAVSSLPRTFVSRGGAVTVDAREASRVAERVNEALEATGHGLLFLVDEESGRPVVRAVQAHSRELLREVPLRELLEIYESLQRYHGWLRRQRI